MSVAVPDDEPLFDEAAGPLVRPYSLTNGRTRPTSMLDLVSMVRATGRRPSHMEPEHLQTLELCGSATSVAEVAALLQQPLVVAKVLLSDLIGWDAVTTRVNADTPDLPTMEAMLRGLRDLQI